MGYEDGEPLVKALGTAVQWWSKHFPRRIYREDDPLNPLWAAVMLVRASDLSAWERLPRYGEHVSISYLDYKKEADRIADLRRAIPQLIEAREKIDELSRDQMTRYDTKVVKVPGSLRRRRVRLPLPAPEHDQTVYETSSDVEISDGVILAWTRWRPREVYLRLSCPLRVLHAAEIEEKRQWLAAQPAEDLAKLGEVESSWSAHPVLFISHRWEALEHPDPRGDQLARLRGLNDCFLIYDYCSFPQDSRSEVLKLILDNMTSLVTNVVVLNSSDYAQRGWCLYEYLIASFKVAIVCDEINDPDFVALRQWSATHGPVDLSLKGHSHDSNIQNTISREILEAVNRIRPRYIESAFSVQGDRALVTKLLVEHLVAVLPRRKEYSSGYLGEWIDKPWSTAEVTRAFTEPLSWDTLTAREGDSSLSTLSNLPPSDLDVPTTIEGAVRRRYAVTKPGAMGSLESIARVFESFTR